MNTASRCTHALLTMWVALTLVGPLMAADDGAAPRWLEPGDEVVTPHIRWMKPAEGGAVRVLFITYRQGMREIVELSQRFDIEREVFALDRRDMFSQPDTPDGNDLPNMFPGIDEASDMKRLREKLAQDYDCIVIGNVVWKAIPGWAREQIMRKVYGGTGLLGYIRSPDNYVLGAVKQRISQDPCMVFSSFPFSGLPAFEHFKDFEEFFDATVDLRQFGQARVALLKGFDCPTFQMLTPEIVGSFTDRRMVHYDYYLAWAGALIHWVAGMDAEVRVVPSEAAVLKIERSDFSNVTFALDANIGGAFDLAFVLRDADSGEPVDQAHRSVELEKGRSEVTFDVSAVPAGGYFADLWINRAGNTVNFGSLMLEIASETRIITVKLESDAFADSDLVKHYSLNDRITGRIIVQDVQEDQKLEVLQFDNHDRLIAREGIALAQAQGEQRVDFSMTSRPPRSVLQWLEVRLIDGDQVVDQHRQSFTYHDFYLADDDVHHILWQGYPGKTYICAYIAQRLHEAGFDLWWLPREDDEVDDGDLLIAGEILRANLYEFPDLFFTPPVRPRPWGTPILSDKGYIRVPCLTDPVVMKHILNTYGVAAASSGSYASHHFDLGAECTLTLHHPPADVCVSPTCLAGFRDYLKQQYGSLEKVNEEYQSSYSNWYQIDPVDYATAARTSQIPRWIDHRRHMDSVWANYYRQAREVIENVVPDARVGYHASGDGGHSPTNPGGLGGNDYAKMADAMTLNFPYPSVPQIAAIRDLTTPPPGCPAPLNGIGWMGGYSNLNRGARYGPWSQWLIWNGILRGANAITVWQGTGLSRDILVGTTIAPDLSWYDFAEDINRTARQIRGGVGKLMLAMDRPHDGIAVLYSRPSILLAEFSPDFLGAWDGFASVPYLFTEAGFQYRFISPDQLKDGYLNQESFRVLYLPHCQALSDQEVDGIRQFVSNGGLVVADLRPGVADDHGKPYAAGALDEVFGVKQDTAHGEKISGPVVFERPFGDARGFEHVFRADGTLALAGGKALGRVEDAPALIINTYGQGQAVLLNFALSDAVTDQIPITSRRFWRFHNDALAERTAAFLQALYAKADLKAVAPIRPHVPGCHSFHYRSGAGALIGVLYDIAPHHPGVGHIGGLEAYRQIETHSKLATVHLGDAKHVYDVLREEYVGFRDHVECQLEPGQVRLLAALPYQVESVSIKTSGEKTAQGETLNFEVQVDGAREHDQAPVHVYRIEITGPDGNVRKHYSAKLIAPQGVGLGQIPLALNDEPGLWTVTAQDVATGVKGKASFSLVTLKD